MLTNVRFTSRKTGRMLTRYDEFTGHPYEIEEAVFIPLLPGDPGYDSAPFAEHITEHPAERFTRVNGEWQRQS